jgi:hypothetical protein
MQQIIIYLNIKPYRILFFSKIRHVEELRHANAILRSGTPPLLDQDHELWIAYHRLGEAEHGWHYFHQELDAAREVLDERTHAIIHLEHHIEQQDL